MTTIKHFFARHFKYFDYLLKHKYYVAIECFKHGFYWRGLVHDLSKFLFSEWLPYAKYFYDLDNQKEYKKNGCMIKPFATNDVDFDFAWLKHQKRNRHHWQWWVLPEDDGNVKILAMDRESRIEMLCDWIGAGKARHGAQNGGIKECKSWYNINKNKISLHPETRKWVEDQLYRI